MKHYNICWLVPTNRSEGSWKSLEVGAWLENNWLQFQNQVSDATAVAVPFQTARPYPSSSAKWWTHKESQCKSCQCGIAAAAFSYYKMKWRFSNLGAIPPHVLPTMVPNGQCHLARWPCWKACSILVTDPLENSEKFKFAYMLHQYSNTMARLWENMCIGVQDTPWTLKNQEQFRHVSYSIL